MGDVTLDLRGSLALDFDVVWKLQSKKQKAVMCKLWYLQPIMIFVGLFLFNALIILSIMIINLKRIIKLG